MPKRKPNAKPPKPRAQRAPPVGTSRWYSFHIRKMEAQLRDASPTAYASLILKLGKFAEARDAKLREEEAASGSHLTPEQRLDRWAQSLSRLPDAWLEVALQEWAQRKRVDLHALLRGQLAVVRA